MELKVQFKTPQQRAFYYSTARNQCISGGFCNGKTWILCFKALTLCLTFSNYRHAIARELYTDLRKTTMQTFLMMCPSELIASHNEQEGSTQLINGSMIHWLHLDRVEENTLKSLELNSASIDQGEEVAEAVFLALDSRVGRWSHAIVPQHLIDSYPDWPRKDGRPIVPSYFMIGCNPDTEFNYIYRKYHPSSVEHDPSYFFVEAEWQRELGSEEGYDEALKRDPEWVNKYVKGIWGSSNAAIHFVRPDSLLSYTPDLLRLVKAKGFLCRILDHGSTAPTCCVWCGAVKGVYIFYREYYTANQRISYHRKEISNLSLGEEYQANYADPHIFDKASQAKGGIYSVADEYMDSDLEAPPLFWMKADNNEFATRNRINELLSLSNNFKHPVTGLSPAPGIYFIKASDEYPNGCRETIRQLGAQRKKLIGTIDGKNLYAEERDDKITDHAYDCVRYYVAMHGSQPKTQMPRPPRNSFAFYQAILKRQLYRDRSNVSASV